MIPCGDTLMAGEARQEWEASLGRTSDGRKQEWGGFNK